MGLQVGWGRVSGNYYGGPVQWQLRYGAHLPAQCGESQNSASSFVWEKTAPPALAPMPDNSVSPHISLVSSAPLLEFRGGESKYVL